MSGSKKKKPMKMNILPATEEEKRKHSKKNAAQQQIKRPLTDESVSQVEGKESEKGLDSQTDARHGGGNTLAIPYQDMSWGSAVELEENLQKRPPPQPATRLSGKEFYEQLSDTCPSYYQKCQKSGPIDPLHLCQSKRSQPSGHSCGKPAFPTQSGQSFGGRSNVQQQYSQSNGGRFPTQQQQQHGQTHGGKPTTPQQSSHSYGGRTNGQPSGHSYSGKSTTYQQSNHSYGGRPPAQQQQSSQFYGGRPSSQQQQGTGQSYGGRNAGQQQQQSGHSYGGRPLSQQQSSQPHGTRSTGPPLPSHSSGSRPSSQQHIVPATSVRFAVQGQSNQSFGGKSSVAPQLNQSCASRTNVPEPKPPLEQNVAQD